jgi:hypothetical protein
MLAFWVVVMHSDCLTPQAAADHEAAAQDSLAVSRDSSCACVWGVVVLLCRLVVALGSLCCVCGYLGMYLMVAGLAPKNFVQLLFFAAAAGEPQAFGQQLYLCDAYIKFGVC